MTIKSKVNKNTLDKVISGGGSVKADQSELDYTNICLRIRKDTLDRVDELSKNLSISRAHFIRESINDKIRTY